MTKEEAIERLRKMLTEAVEFEDSVCYVAEEDREREPLEMAIKALEQEPILDKIRAEIEQTTSRYCISRERGCSGQVEWSDRLLKESEVLEIIDKYKAESEDKE